MAMSLDRTELIELRREAEDKFRKAEEDYRRDIQAIDRLLERYCLPLSTLPPPIPLLPYRPMASGPSELEAKLRNAMTMGNRASPWSAPILYERLRNEYNFPQQRNGAVNSILAILKKWAAQGIVHEEKGKGRRASLFTWDEAIYPKGPTNGGVHYAPIGMPTPVVDEGQTAGKAED